MPAWDESDGSEVSASLALALGFLLGTVLVAAAFVLIGYALNRINPPKPPQECFPLDALAGACRKYLDDSPNYVEMKFTDNVGGILVTVQKLSFPTPHEKRLLAEQRVRELEAQLDERVPA
jgi:hypothetical protein